MKTDKIQSINFQSYTIKKRLITPNMKSGIESLLIRMNPSTISEESGDYYVSTLTTKLKNTKGYVFEDYRGLNKKLPNNEQMRGFSRLKIGKIRLDIDNLNGEIVDFKKPFYKPWFLVLKKAEKVIDEFRNNYYSHFITKETKKIQEPISEGISTIRQFILK